MDAGKKLEVGGQRIRLFLTSMIIEQLLVIVAMGVTGMLFPFYSNAGLNAGDPAPEFTLPDQKGDTVRLSDFSGKKTVVLAFYIKASTPG